MRERKAATVFILITLFLDILGIGIIIPVLPELVKELTASFGGVPSATAARYYGLIGMSYALMQFVFAPILGALSDRFGRRPVLLISLFGLGVDYLIQGFAPTIGWLFLGRCVAGIMGASITTANAYIADVSTPETRARNFGLVGAAFGLGFIFGPALGGLLGGVSLRLPFFVSAGLVFVNWLYGYFVLPESLPESERSEFSWRRANPVASLRRLTDYPLVASLAGAFVLLALAQRGLENVWVLYMGYRYGWDEQMNGLTLALVGVVVVIVQGTLVRPAIRRFGERRCIVLGLSWAVFSFLGYGLATEGWMILVVIVLGGIGGVAGPALQGLVAGSVPPSEQGKVQGVLTSLMSLTAIVAPILFTAGLFGFFTSEAAPVRLPGAPFLFGSLVNLGALLWVVRYFRRHPESEGAPGASAASSEALAAAGGGALPGADPSAGPTTVEEEPPP